MKNIITDLLLILGLTISAGAQTLPDAPQPQPKPYRPTSTGCGPRWAGGCWDYSHPTLSVRDTFKSKQFWIPIALGDGAYWADALESRAAIKRGCIEGNADLPANPTVGDYAINWAKFELPLDVLEWAIIRLNRRPTNYIVNAMTAARVTVHMRGVHAAVGCH